MSNGYLDHASYFLCQMDRLKMDIPRELLDLFLDFSVRTKIFENAENVEATASANPVVKNGKSKYDSYEAQKDADYAYYFSKKNLYKNRKDMKNLISNISMKVESKPFFPRNTENENQQSFDKIKERLNGIDPSTIKEFVPKSYKIQKKAEN